MSDSVDQKLSDALPMTTAKPQFDALDVKSDNGELSAQTNTYKTMAEQQGMEVNKVVSTKLPAAPKPKMSKGEKIYNWIVYSGINYWVNLISSVLIADWLTRRGTSGNVGLSKAVNGVARGITKTGIMAEEAAHQVSRVGIETLALMSGGWALLPITTPIENHKREIVHWINEKKGVDQTGPDGRELRADQIYIEQEQPHQNAWSALRRRLTATAAVVGTGLALDYGLANRNAKITRNINYYGEEIQQSSYLGGKQRVTNFILGKLNWLLEKIPLIGKKAVVRTASGEIDKGHVVQRLMDLTALDTVFTKITALVMFFTRGAQKAKLPNEVGDDAAPASQVMPGEEFGVVEEKSNFAGNVLKRSPTQYVANAVPKTSFVAAQRAREITAMQPIGVSL